MRFAFAALLLALISMPVSASDLRVPATILRLKDGDTFVVRAQIWPQHFIETTIRLRGLDTPEKHGKCEAERRRALEAEAFLDRLPKEVILTDIDHDKYGGRYDSTVLLPDGRDLAGLIISAGYGRAYQGGKRRGWC